MNEYRRIYVPLSQEEFFALSASAQYELRHPRDQARAILRHALGLKNNASAPTNSKSAVTLTETGAFASVNP